MKKKKETVTSIKSIKGQISLWDMPNIFSKKESKIIEIKEENIKTDYISLTREQEKTIQSFKLKSIVYRIIHYAKGSVGIETEKCGVITNHYINKDGKEEFSYNNNSPVLLEDKIIYSKINKQPLTKIQTDKLQKLLASGLRDKILKVIKRNGDFNLLIELEDKVISILKNGWEIELNKRKPIDHSEEEIYLIPTKIEHESLEDMQKKVKTGDYVQARYGKRNIEGEITREYGIGKAVLNIVFDKGKKHTAIGRMQVLKILNTINA